MVSNVRNQTTKVILRRIKKINPTVIYGLVFIILMFLISFELRLIQSEIQIKKIISSGIDYDAFRNVKVSNENIELANDRMKRITKKNPQLKNLPYIDAIGYLTFSMMAKDYNTKENGLLDDKTFLRGLARIVNTPSFQELYHYYKAILFDVQYFPVPEIRGEEAGVSYVDTWFVLRKYGGNRRHEGTDLMTSNNIRGYFPILSITDGVVEKIGWLEQGGYRIGIRAPSGGYFYYAHLHNYAPGIQKGDQVIAGQLLGFMGDSGYGDEGTVGKFDVHLHLGIYVQGPIGEFSVNPYWVLRLIDENRISYEYN